MLNFKLFVSLLLSLITSNVKCNPTPMITQAIQEIGSDIENNFVPNSEPIPELNNQNEDKSEQINTVPQQVPNSPKIPYNPNLAQILLLQSAKNPNPEVMTRAKAVLVSEYGVEGEIDFEQLSDGPVVLTGRIKGLPPGKHGFHFHEYPVVGSDCESAGEHYNPFGNDHGGREDRERHLGDLGNVNAQYHGTAHIAIVDPFISLHGPRSVLGRSIVVHTNEDDLGRGRNPESRRTGNSGGRLACGTLVLLNVHNLRIRTFNPITKES